MLKLPKGYKEKSQNRHVNGACDIHNVQHDKRSLQHLEVVEAGEFVIRR